MQSMAAAAAVAALALGLAAAAGAAAESPCDPLVPHRCYMPYPNDFWRSAEGTLNLTGVPPAGKSGMVIDAAQGGWNALDGFSPTVSALSYVANVSLDATPGVARLWNVADSTKASSPTVLLDTVTGELVEHFVELDHRSDEAHPEGYERALMLWPARALVWGRRYVWAYRGLRTTSGAAAPAGAYFAALRDASKSADPARLARFEREVFAPLAAASVERATLQLAWDFTVVTQDATQGRLLYMRDDAMRRLGGPLKAPKYTIDSVEDDYSQWTARRVTGQFSVPLYLRTAAPGPDARLVLNATTGMPVYQGEALANFTVLVPRSAVDAQGRGLGNSSLLQYGHGLFGHQSEVHEHYLQNEANEQQRVMVAIDWWGLCETDVLYVASMFSSNLTNFGMIPDRLQQGVVNHHVANALVANGLALDKALQLGGAPVLSPPGRGLSVYSGNSLGGIMGTTYVATSGSLKYPSANVTRGVLGVNGGPFTLLLPRSVDFDVLWKLLNATQYPDPTDKIFTLALVQGLWDPAGPGGYMGSTGSAPPRGTMPHQTLQQYGVGDAQVTYLGAYAAGRSAGASMFSSNVHEANQTLAGFPFVGDSQNVTVGQFIQGYAFAGVPPVPQINVPPGKALDTHECVRRSAPAIAQQRLFFDEGVIHNFCEGTCVDLACPKRLLARARVAPRWHERIHAAMPHLDLR